MNNPQSTTSGCRNCGNPAVSRFCPDCGQRQLSREQYSLRHLTGELFGNLLQWDSKLLRTMSLALRKPGELSAIYLDGAKTRYTSPVTLLLLVFFVFFISPQLTDFTQPLDAHLKWGQWYSAPAKAWLDQLVAESGTDQIAFSRHFADVQANIAKTTVLLHVPLFALVLLLLHCRRRMYFVEHVVVASHFVASLMLVFFLVLLLFLIPLEFGYERAGWGAIPADTKQLLVKVGLNVPFSLLLFALLKNAYRQPWYLALLKTPVAIFGLAVVHTFYRAITFYLTLLLS